MLQWFWNQSSMILVGDGIVIWGLELYCLSLGLRFHPSQYSSVFSMVGLRKYSSFHHPGLEFVYFSLGTARDGFRTVRSRERLSAH